MCLKKATLQTTSLEWALKVISPFTVGDAFWIGQIYLLNLRCVKERCDLMGRCMIVIKQHSPCMRFRHAAKDKDKFMVTFVVLVTCTFCLVVLRSSQKNTRFPRLLCSQPTINIWCVVAAVINTVINMQVKTTGARSVP